MKGVVVCTPTLCCPGRCGWPCMVAGWGGGDEGMVVGWWAYPCVVAGLLVDAIDSTTLSTQLMGWGSSSRRGVRGGGSG